MRIVGRGPMSPVERFADLVTHDEVDLAEAALILAAGASPELDVPGWLAHLERLSLGIADLDGLRARLFVELGLRGDMRGYYDPENSFLQRVLERRRGIPISLCVITIEVGRRAGISLEGVGMPGHFLVRATDTQVLLDPFEAGRVLTPEAAEELFRGTTGAGEEVTFGPALLPVVGTLEILARMLANLRALYRAAGDAVALEWVLRMRLALPGTSDRELLELGEAIAAQGRFLDGAAELERRAASGEDPDSLTVAARSLRARLN